MRTRIDFTVNLYVDDPDVVDVLLEEDILAPEREPDWKRVAVYEALALQEVGQ